MPRPSIRFKKAASKGRTPMENEELVTREASPRLGITIQFRDVPGATVTVTLDHGAMPADNDEAVALASEVIAQLAVLKQSAISRRIGRGKVRDCDEGDLFRSWALPRM